MGKQKNKIIKYKDGLTLLYRKGKSQKAVFFEFRFRGGLYNDPQDKLGLCHFAEHSVAFSNSDYTKDEKSEYLKSLYYSNFATSKNSVYFHAYVPDDMFEEAFKTYCNYLVNMNISQEEFDNEKKVIKQEILRRKVDKDIELEYTWLENTYNKPYVRIRPAGIIETVDPITKEDVEKYRKENLVLKNCILTVAGNISCGRVKRIIKKYLQNSLPVGEDKTYFRGEDYTLTRKKPVMIINPSPDGEKSVISVIHYLDFDGVIDRSKSYMSFVINENINNAAKSYFRDIYGLTYHAIARFSSYINEYGCNFTRNYFKINLDCDENNIKTVLEMLPGFYEHMQSYMLDEEKLKEIRHRIKGFEKMKVSRTVREIGEDVSSTYFSDGYFLSKKAKKKQKKFNEKINYEEFNKFIKELLNQKPSIFIVSNTKDELPEYKKICSKINKNLKWSKQ